MPEQYYLLRLWDPSVPPFVSADRMYIGSESEIQRAMEAMEANSVCEDTVEAYKRYVAGDKAATHNMAYRDVPVLERVTLIRSSIITIGEQKWEHINAWNYPYSLKFDSAEITRIIVKYKRKYLRCYRVTFNNLYCENTSGGWEKLNSFFLGNSYLLDIQNNKDGSFTENNILFEVESEHDTLVEADDIERSDNINFKFFCDEIFGDC